MANTSPKNELPMRVEKGRNQIYQLTLSGYELSTLIASLRWAAEGGTGELTAEAVSHLKQVLANYDNAISRLQEYSHLPAMEETIENDKKGIGD